MSNETEELVFLSGHLQTLRRLQESTFSRERGVILNRLTRMYSILMNLKELSEVTPEEIEEFINYVRFAVTKGNWSGELVYITKYWEVIESRLNAIKEKLMYLPGQLNNHGIGDIY